MGKGLRGLCLLPRTTPASSKSACTCTSPRKCRPTRTVSSAQSLSASRRRGNERAGQVMSRPVQQSPGKRGG